MSIYKELHLTMISLMHYTLDYKLEILLIIFKHFSMCPKLFTSFPCISNKFE